jgi:hypothetical protein
MPPTAALRAARRRLRRRLAPLRGAILLRAARAKYLYQYRKVASFSVHAKFSHSQHTNTHKPNSKA